MIRFSKVRKIHFAGIGGAGMSGIAEVLKNMGFDISGSDISESDTVRRLRGSGIKVYIGHRKENVEGAGTLVYSSAVKKNNIEVVTASEMKIPVIPRAEMLAELMRVKFSIAVAGTHGKTSTTSMIAGILGEAGMDPTYVVGGKLKTGESGAKLGGSEFLVAEADESDGSFLKLFPTIAVITNIEDDHLDHYGSLEALAESFADFANKVPFYGSVVLNRDCPGAAGILNRINKKVVTFGLSEAADIRAVNMTCGTFGSGYDLVVHGQQRARVELNAGGLHNIMNSLAAVAASIESNAGLDEIVSGLSKFSLPDRRFQILYRGGGIIVIDDYAHHPTEIRATLATLKRSDFRRIITVFQPHRFTRLQKLMEEFAGSFAGSDVLVLAEIYAANQQEIEGVSSGVLAGKVRDRGMERVHHIGNMTEILSFLKNEVLEGDAVAFLSAGDLSGTAHEFAAMMESR